MNNKESKILPIVCYDSPILRSMGIEAENNEETRYVIECLLKTMSSIKIAVGLAAQQINSNLNFFVMNPFHTTIPIIVVNPWIVKQRDIKTSGEGCLSLPGINEDIKRNSDIEVGFYDENFNKRRLKLKGWEAFVFLHEFDHLNGILFIDHMTKEGRESIQDKLSDLANGRFKPKFDMVLNDIPLLTTEPSPLPNMINPYLDMIKEENEKIDKMLKNISNTV